MPAMRYAIFWRQGSYMNKRLYYLKARICEYFDWFRQDFDPDRDPHVIYDERSGSYVDYECAGTVYWYELYVVGTGFRNWWYSFEWDSSG